MSFAFPQRHTDFQENQNMALFPKPISSFWLYFSKKLITFSFLIRCLEVLKGNCEATSLIFIMKPQAS